jgi:hypothetical protein
MSDPEATPPLAAGQIEIWKKIVDVQQHFNDLELRIRNFALIVTGAFLGLGGYAIRDGGTIVAFGWEVSVAGLVVLSAIFPLLAFYFMDRLWYHRLLDGAVQAGIEAEAALKDLGYKVGLGSSISAKSPFTLWISGRRIHSRTKMDIFYWMLVMTLFVVGACLGLGVRHQPLPVPLVEASSNEGESGVETASKAALPAISPSAPSNSPGGTDGLGASESAASVADSSKE